MPQPTVSVVIPAYNCESYIGLALDSINAQIRRPDQVVVVDDGSTDGTAGILEAYRFTEDRFQSYLSFVGKVFPRAASGNYRPDTKRIEFAFLRQENSGPSAARNKGIRNCSSEWIAFLDADDIWLPWTVGTLLELTQNYPQSAIVFGDGLNFTENGKALARLSETLGNFHKGAMVGAFESIAKGNPILNGAVLADRKLINTAGGFREDISHGEDHDLWLKLALFTQPACTDEVVLLRRRHRGELSSDQEAFYRTRPRLLSDIKRAYSDVLTRNKINIEESIVAAHYTLAYFYYVQKMPLKASVAAARWAWAYARNIRLTGRRIPHLKQAGRR